jgi:diacylglycerol kinase (ATP)
MPEINNEKILFVINPISGGAAKIDWEALIRTFFDSSKGDPEFFVLDGGIDQEAIREQIEKIKPAKVVAVGGDGTVSMIARLVLGKGIALGILPAGSANGMAKELGIPETAEEALKIISNGNLRDSDAICVNDQICLHLSDIGLNAQLIKHFEEGKFRGKLGYATKVIKTLWTKSIMQVKIKIEDKEVSVKALMVVLANATKYGTGAVINPGGNLYDGIFEVVIMKKLAITELFKMWFRPRAFDPAKIRLFPATSVTINTKSKVHFQVDGEYLGKVKKVEAHILAGQLKLIVP